MVSGQSRKSIGKPRVLSTSVVFEETLLSIRQPEERPKLRPRYARGTVKCVAGAGDESRTRDPLLGNYLSLSAVAP